MADTYEAPHQKPNGPGDGRPTCYQIVEDEGLEGKWTGRVVLITGCSSGIGVETAKALHKTGATLYLTARNLKKAETALGTDLCKSETVHLLELDLNSLVSVRACASTFLATQNKLHTLICNAGVMASPEGRTQDGFETQLGTNHLSHFLLINLLLPTLLATGNADLNARIVILTSVAHRYSPVQFSDLNFEKNFESMTAYGSSKTANLWTANYLDRAYKSQNLRAWGVHPGGIMTGLMVNIPKDQLALFSEHPVLKYTMKSPPQGAATTVWAASAKALEGMGGRYLEDVQIGKPVVDAGDLYAAGYAEWAYDEAQEDRLWEISKGLVGL